MRSISTILLPVLVWTLLGAFPAGTFAAEVATSLEFDLQAAARYGRAVPAHAIDAAPSPQPRIAAVAADGYRCLAPVHRIVSTQRHRPVRMPSRRVHRIHCPRAPPPPA
jgi:hypothetical protein